MKNSFINFFLIYIFIILGWFLLEKKASSPILVDKYTNMVNYTYQNEDLELNFSLSSLSLASFKILKYNKNIDLKCVFSNKTYFIKSESNKEIIFASEDQEIKFTFDKYLITITGLTEPIKIYLDTSRELSGLNKNIYLTSLQNNTNLSWLGKSTNSFLFAINGNFIYNKINDTCLLSGDFNKIYLGPKDINELQNVDSDFPLIEKTIYYGVFSFLILPLSNLANYIYQYVHNYAIVIIILTILLRMLTFFIMYRSHVNISKINKIQPRIDLIERKFSQGTPDYNYAINKLYEKENIDPMARFWSQIVQLPIYYSIYSLLLYDISFKNASFLYLTDIAGPDNFVILNLFFFDLKLLPIILACTMFLQNNYIGNMQKHLYTLPIFIVLSVFFNSFPAGLIIYMIINGLLGIIGEGLLKYIIK